MLHRTLAAVAATATALLAQNDYDLDKIAPGTLGGGLVLQVRNAPQSQLMLSMPAFTPGPLPLALVDPSDPRSVQVGLELSGAWGLSLTSPTGTAQISMPLPLVAGFAGLVMHWQTLTLPGTSTLVNEISNDVVAQFSMPGAPIAAPDSLVASRAFAQSFVDADNNGGQGDVVIAGGGTGTLTGATGLASSEVWDFRHMRRVAGPSMNAARALHLAVPLLDGRVLLIGGVDAIGTTLASCELYDPVTNTFTPTGSMATARVMHAACRLATGQVMAAGGTSSLVDVTAAITNVQNTVEIYDPATGTWSPAANLGGRRLAPALTLLPNNQIMVSGGVDVTILFGVPIAASSTTAVQRWNPGNNTWTNGPNMSQGRAGHHYNQVRLLDGRILMTGGTNVPSLLGAQNATAIAGAEAYNPATNSWATFNMPNARTLHSATALADGRVIVCGGAQGTLTLPTPIDNVDVFDSFANSWSPGTPLLAARASHASALLPDGTLLLFGGQGPGSTVNTIEALRF